MDSGLMALDHAGRITTINKRALEWIAEHDRDKVLNTFFGRFFPEFLSCWSEQQRWCANRNTVHSPERGIVFGFRVTELPEAHGWLVLFSDITEVKKLEKRVQDMEKMATVGELAAGLAHEMKNPLAGIKASLQLLLSNDLEEDHARRLSAVIVRDIDRLDFLLKDFLVFARPLAASPEDVAVAEAVEDVLMPLRLRYPRVAVNVELGTARVVFDRNHLHQILLNLCVNAFQAVEGRDEARISITAHDGGRKLVISDNGPGMSPEIRARCFDPFVTTKAVGTGLGLSIAQRLAAQNGAFIDVDSDPAGTRVALVRNSSPDSDMA
jgi:signal transduction histidine kinase